MAYVDDHPTHWNVREDIYALAQYICGRHGSTWNSYYDHPPGYNLAYDHLSVDFWGPNGRGDPVGLWLGHSIFGHLFYDPEPPHIDWIIWQGWIWTYYGGWEWFSGDEPWSDNGHFRHVHVTYF